MTTKIAALAATLLLIQVNSIAQDQDANLAQSRALSSQLAQLLGAELKREIANGGPARAIETCRTLAPEIASRLSRENGVRLTRVSPKTRNPLLGTPDAWEQGVLRNFEQRLAAGEQPEGLEFAETIDEPQGRYFRYMKAIPVQPLCLSCHGTSEVISKEVAGALAQQYPHDVARGYLPGQLRGAFSVKKAIAPQ